MNLAGEVIGINTLVVRGSGSGSDVAKGIGFALPAGTAQAVAEQIIQTGYFARPYLGIRGQSITPNIAATYNLPVQWGLFVARVIPDSPASRVGSSGEILSRRSVTPRWTRTTLISTRYSPILLEKPSRWR